MRAIYLLRINAGQGHIKDTTMTQPANPFILPELTEDEVVYAESRLKTASVLAAQYISARAEFNSERSSACDRAIGAFLDREFGPIEQPEHDSFSTKFAGLVTECDQVFPLSYQRFWLTKESR